MKKKHAITAILYLIICIVVMITTYTLTYDVVKRENIEYWKNNDKYHIRKE